MSHRQSIPQPQIYDNGKFYGWACPMCDFFTGYPYGFRSDAIKYGRYHISKDH